MTPYNGKENNTPPAPAPIGSSDAYVNRSFSETEAGTHYICIKYFLYYRLQSRGLKQLLNSYDQTKGQKIYNP